MTHPRLPAAVEWLQQLAAFDTTPAKSNKPMVAHIARRLREENGICGAQKDGGEYKTTFLARIGPDAPGGVALSGHTDVVDVAGQNWTLPPFELTEKDGRLHARGACDMKGFLACALAMAPVFAAAPLKKPAFLAFSRDEEIACAGSEDMLQMFAECNNRPESAIVGEPTRMQTVAGHKTGLTFRTIFYGSAAHSSMPAAGISAIPFAARFVSYLQSLENKMAENAASGAASNSPFTPPYGTINVGTIRGGTALNIFAAQCEMEWHYRGMPEDSLEEFAAAADAYLQKTLLPEMLAGGHPADIINKQLSSYPGLLPEESPALRLVESLTGNAKREAVSFGTEAGHFQRGGIAAVVIGPGDIQQAHKPDEYIEIPQLAECLTFLEKLSAHLSA
ncbi:MAG: acetylornithine deacetylase [Gammaproteobacteria bacterium]